MQAETGSGKTLAFLLPLLSQVDPARQTVQALVVVPTRELGLQVARVAKRLASASVSSSSASNNDASSNNNNIMVMSVLQGSANRRQRAWAWSEPPHVVIGTPVELCQMIQKGGIRRYNSVRFVVVDEVDACLLHQQHGSSSSSMAPSTAMTTTQYVVSESFLFGNRPARTAVQVPVSQF